jgi:hypothetical protein
MIKKIAAIAIVTVLAVAAPSASYAKQTATTFKVGTHCCG